MMTELLPSSSSLFDADIMAHVNELFAQAYGAIDPSKFQTIFMETPDSRPDTIYPESGTFPVTTIRLTVELIPNKERHFPLQLAYQYAHELFHVYQREVWHGELYGRIWLLFAPVHPFAHAAALATLYQIRLPGLTKMEHLEYLVGAIPPQFPEYKGGAEIAIANNWSLAEIHQQYRDDFGNLMPFPYGTYILNAEPIGSDSQGIISGSDPTRSE
jgi:hypothetical protein